MTETNNTTAVIIIIVISAIASFITGCEFGKMKCQKAGYTIGSVSSSDTLTRSDSTQHAVIRSASKKNLPIFTGKFTGKLPVNNSGLPVKVDTTIIIQGYYTRYYQVDTFRNNDLELITQDSLYNNRTSYRAYKYKILRPDTFLTKTITNTIAQSNAIFVGASVIQSQISPLISVNALLVKNNFAFSIGGGYNIIQAGIYYKIR